MKGILGYPAHALTAPDQLSKLKPRDYLVTARNALVAHGVFET
jgi:hypothetical protein